MICTDKIPKPHTWPIPFFAHRGGALNRNEENSLAAFGRALDEKCPGIELDVHYVNGTVKVSHYKKYAAGKKAPAFEEALHFIHEKCRGQKIPKPIMNIDLKSKGVGEAVAEIIKKMFCRENGAIPILSSQHLQERILKAYGRNISN